MNFITYQMNCISNLIVIWYYKVHEPKKKQNTWTLPVLHNRDSYLAHNIERGDSIFRSSTLPLDGKLGCFFDS
jgi:hypothetical protein